MLECVLNLRGVPGLHDLWEIVSLDEDAVYLEPAKNLTSLEMIARPKAGRSIHSYDPRTPSYGYMGFLLGNIS